PSHRTRPPSPTRRSSDLLLRRRLDIRLGTGLESCVGGLVRLSDGDSFQADTIVWTAGVKPDPMVRDTDLPLDENGRIRGPSGGRSEEHTSELQSLRDLVC